MTIDKIKIKNNIFISSGDRDIFFNDGTDAVEIINNSHFGAVDAAIYLGATLTANGKIINNIIHGNGATNIGIYITVQIGVIDYNTVYDCTTNYDEGATKGPHGKEENPLFNDPDNGDLTLQHGSPCLDAGAGNGTYSEVPIIDLLNVNRPILQPDLTPVDDGTDMGAYEMQQFITPPYTPKNYKQFSRAERFTGAQRIIDVIESDVNEGTIFQSTHTEFTIADTELKNILIITPSDVDETYKKTIKLLGFFAIASGQPWRAELYEDAVAVPGSTNKIGYNHNRQSTNAPLLIVNEDPTGVISGTLIDEAFFGGGTGDKKDATVEGGLLFAQWVLKKNTKYIIRLINNTGSENSASVSIYWKEYNTHV